MQSHLVSNDPPAAPEFIISKDQAPKARQCRLDLGELTRFQQAEFVTQSQYLPVMDNPAFLTYQLDEALEPLVRHNKYVLHRMQ